MALRALAASPRPHGVIQTPAFMPVGTRAAVTGLTAHELRELGAEMILGNTYHLALRPGPEAMRQLGGLHRFMGWDRGILTDSGGFQIFSLAQDRVVTEDGARFRSYVDGREHLLTPESSIAVQEALGSDVMMVLDVCPPSSAPRRRSRRRCSARTVGRCAVFRRGDPTRRRCSRSCKVACRRRGARSRRSSWPSTRSTASPSAGWRSAIRAASAAK
jgi:tRNA-guanine family transglycosylase